MSATRKRTMVCWAASAVVICTSAVAHAGGPVALTNHQLDLVTAAQGGAAASAVASAEGLGLWTFGGTQTTALTTVGSPGNDGPFGGSSSLAVASAYGGGTNGLTPGSGTAMASTFTEAPGNVTANVGWSYTVYGIGTVVQTSVSGSTGEFVPGMP